MTHSPSVWVGGWAGAVWGGVAWCGDECMVPYHCEVKFWTPSNSHNQSEVTKSLTQIWSLPRVQESMGNYGYDP